MLVKCDECGHKVKPSSLVTHKLKNCKGFIENKEETVDDSTNNHTDCVENVGYQLIVLNTILRYPNKQTLPDTYINDMVIMVSNREATLPTD